MPKKLLPYAFLAFLFAVLLFIVGIRYGQHVEQVNKTVSYLISIPPSPMTSPTTTPLSFKTYKNATCGASLLIPSQLIKTQESSTSAVFSTVDKKLAIALSCEKKTFVQNKGEKIVTLNTLRSFETTTNDTTSYRLFNPKNAYVLTLTATHEFLPLLESSFEINKP